MRIKLIAYTDQGLEIGQRLVDRLSVEHDINLVRSGKEATCRGWTAEHFGTADALGYIGAVGIAVRSIAPHVKDKFTDPAVIAIDTTGTYVIPLLSGHVGGANRLARQMADILGAEAVITTGTDQLGHTAIDEWAVLRGLTIANPRAIVTVSSKLLRGERATLISDFPLAGQLPMDLTYVENTPDIAIDCRSDAPAGALHLVVPTLTLGIGCRRGTPAADIEAAFTTFMAQQGYHTAAVRQVVSIDLKADEAGLLAFCEARGLPFIIYPAGALAALPGNFTPSDFVRETTGVDNVCERAAAMQGGVIIVPKTAMGGITLALARGEYPLSFEELTI